MQVAKVTLELRIPERLSLRLGAREKKRKRSLRCRLGVSFAAHQKRGNPSCINPMAFCRICGKPLTWIQNLFNRTVHDTCREIHGYIGHLQLSDWWLSSFDEDERQYIELAFTPLGLGIIHEGARPTAEGNSLLTGSRGLQVYGRAGTFLANLAEWLNKPECRHLARRVIEQAEAIASDPLEKHDVFQVMVVVNYRDRKKHPTFLHAAIRACQKQIDIAPEAIRLWRSQRRRTVPTHNGFEQLAIIREKEGNYAAAIRLSQAALKQGWRGVDWEGRIRRCKRKAAEREGKISLVRRSGE